MNRPTRMGIGLIALIPVLALTGGAFVAAGAGGVTTAWITLGVGFGWLLAAVWWAMRAPPARSEAASQRYWAPLRHAGFDSSDRDESA